MHHRIFECPKYLFLIWMALGSVPAFAGYEYIRNGDFETTSTSAGQDLCDPQYYADHFNGFFSFLIPNWKERSHPKLLHRCFQNLVPNNYPFAAAYNHAVPQNDYGFQEPHSGNGMALFRLFWLVDNYIQNQIFPIDNQQQFQGNRAVLMNELKQPLDAGWTYRYKFFVNLPERTSYAAPFGVYFLDHDWVGFGPEVDINPINGQGDPILGKMNSIPVAKRWIAPVLDKNQWTEIQGQFQAQGNEKFFMLASFQDQYQLGSDLIPTGLNPANSYEVARAHYFIDDVSLQCVNEAHANFLIAGSTFDFCNDDPVIELQSAQFTNRYRARIEQQNGSHWETIYTSATMAFWSAQSFRTMLSSVGRAVFPDVNYRLVLEYGNHCVDDWKSVIQEIRFYSNFNPIAKVQSFDLPLNQQIEYSVQNPSDYFQWTLFGPNQQVLSQNSAVENKHDDLEKGTYRLQFLASEGAYCRSNQEFQIQVRELLPGDLNYKFPNPLAPEWNPWWKPVGIGFDFEITVYDFSGKQIVRLERNESLHADRLALATASYVIELRFFNHSGSFLGHSRNVLQVIR